ncbi:PKD domain-containing protein [Chitinophagaceae bacterium MMS25-I14]
MKKIYTIYLFVCCIPLLVHASPGNTSLEFIANNGQWNGSFLYKTVTGKGDVYLGANEFTYVVGEPSNKDRIDAIQHAQVKGPEILKFHAYKMHFEGAAAHPSITGGKEQSWYYNYFLGNDPGRWKTGIHPYLALDYAGLYPGVDMHVASQEGNLKYEFILQPGTDPSVIKLRYEGADGISVKNGNLLIRTSVGDIQEMKPYAYQYADGQRKEVACRYTVKNNVVRYDFTGDYDKNVQIVIDPVVVFCTFTGSSADNWGFTATYDAQGNFYAGGLVHGTGYPVTTGAFQVTYAGGVDTAFNSSQHGSGYACDMGIIKFNATGSSKIYATYIGGSDNEQPHSMMVDASNNLVIAGRTYSHNFPVTANAFDTSENGGADIVVVKLNSTGTALMGSTYVGGSGDDGVNFHPAEEVYGNLKHNYGDDARSEVIVDNSGNIYVAASSMSSNFPLTTNATQSTLSGTQDAVIFKMSPALTAMTWSTYLGGSSDDAAYVLALDGNQSHLYVGGGTMSSNFPFTPGTLNPAFLGNTDGYIARFLNSGAYTMQKATAIGTSNYDQVYGLQVDMDNSVYAMGQSLGGAFPVHNAPYSNPNSSQFVIKMDSLLSTNVYSTVYGSGDPSHTNISPVAFLVDTCQNVYISGWGGNLGISQMPSTVGTTNNMPVTANAAQSTTDGFDFYFIVLGKNMQSLLYATFYGRNSTTAFFGEHVDGGTSRFDKNGIVYQAICGGCGGSSGPAFPTTSGSYSPGNGSSNCNEVALKIAFQLGAVDAKANANPNTKGCPPFTVHFLDSSINATSYNWNFGDGSNPDTTYSPTHTFLHNGTYSVRLAIYNPNACRTRDTVFLTIVVDSNAVTSDFNYALIDTCGPYTASFTNTSIYSHTPGSTGFTTFTWLFGDNTSYTGVTPPIHNYPAAGTYTAMLVMKDSTACNNPDTMRKTIIIQNLRVQASMNIPDSLCFNSGVTFNNLSSNADSVIWRFGNGDSSRIGTPVYTYPSPGTYTVTLIAYNFKTCNGIDSITKTIKIKPLPVADFTFSPLIPVPNKPIQFTNQSVNADSYDWSFGDGGTSTAVNPSHFYKKTGHYNVCLTAKNTQGCADTVCKYVDADIHTAVDVPTGFSPNGDGSNDILYVRGGAIETIDFKIFNRWGELVFESKDLSIGWDGTYKGKAQEMDAYAYVLDVTFVDGTSTRKKGNVTLLR